MREQAKDMKLGSMIGRGLGAFLVIWLVIVTIAVGATYLTGAR